MNMKALDFTALTLVIVGAINWGLIGFFKFNLISTIFGGETSIISRIIYAIVGIAGLYSITTYSKMNSNDMVIGNQH